MSAGSNNTDNRVKLPTIKLPRFDGKIEEWKYFSDSFRSMIHDKPHLSNMDKLQYLVTSISGDAAKIIESIELSQDNYMTAWDLLQQRYNDPRSLKKKHIESLFTMPTVAKESAKALRDLIDYTSSHLRILKVLGSPTEAWDELVMHMMEARFDVRTLRAWEEELERKEEASLDDMLQFLRRRCQTLERIESRSVDKMEKSSKGSANTGLKSQSSARGVAKQRTASLTTSLNSGKCYLCNGAHFIYSCEKFLDLPVPDRIKEVRRLKLCLNCLKNDHFARTCRMGRCKECGERHNTLCHLSQDNRVAANPEVPEHGSRTSNETINKVVVHASNHTNGRRILMATAIVEAAQRNGSYVEIRVLLDSASEANFITQAAHNRLGLKRSRVSEIVTGLNEIENRVSSVCEVQVKSRCSNFRINAQCLIVPRITKNLPSSEMDSGGIHLPSNLTLADLGFCKTGPIDMLIGAEFFFDLMEPGKIELEKGQLILQNTKLGWIVAGVMPSIALGNLTCNRGTVSSLTCSLKSSEALSESLEKFWKLENYDVPDARVLSMDEKKCEQHFEQTTTRASDGRFIVRLPFRDKDLPIGSNRKIALRRLNHVERAFKGNLTYRDRYTPFMFEYVKLGHMSIVSDPVSDPENIVYLPHHGVFKESSTSTKLRVVFDASAKNNVGVSLNDALHIGADLQKMFRQVLVHPDDRDFQRILWRFSLDEPVGEYRLNTVIYGQGCATYLAVRCLRQLAMEQLEKYPLASSAILNDTYVDDIISGADTVDAARALQEQLSSLLREGGFEAHKWCSNSESVLTEIPMNLRGSGSNLNIDTNDTTSALGLEWNPASDEFLFKVQMVGGVSTKRRMLSAISKLFDPLGLIGPVLTKAKVLMQELWQIKVDWDDPLPDAVLDRWKRFQENLKEANALRVPRVIASSLKDNRFFVQGFCDASEKAYGACIYLQSVNRNDGRTTVELLCSKARVAPLKKTSIPRLELCSALLLSKLIDKVKRAMRIRVDGISAWSDSMVVLYWLHGDVSRWKSFVSNRVSDIIEILPAIHWNHVKGLENPADLISRGATPAQLRDSHLWWNGPEWLAVPSHSPDPEKSEWEFIEDDISSAKEEMRRERQVCHLSVQQPSSPSEIIHKLVEDCSTLTKIERSLAYCLRFISNCRKKKEDRILSRLTLPELEEARCEIIKYSQHVHFKEDLRNLQGNKGLSRASRLHQLHAFLDKNGVLRVGGRLQETPWSFDRKHPILLPAKCKITHLMIERGHRALLHASPQLLLSSIRQQYWPLNARNLVRRICHSCVWCARNNPRGLTQAMGSLPGDRVKPSRAFSITGVDFAGLIITLVNKGRARKTCKSYIALFICFATRAIHLEATSELTTAAFLATLRRFIGRRGIPCKICSDNATNFTGAKRELEELYSFVRNSINGAVGDALLDDGIEWTFIPPHSPHLGGLWEAGVKSCKYHLKRVMGNTLLTFEELTTLLVQIEACLNSRPLSPLSPDPSDLQPLTPGHFLIGGPLTSLPEISLSDVRYNRLDRWELIQRSLQDFWKRWAAEYVANLQSRVKWKTEQNNLKVNDLVLLRDDNIQPLKWRMGRVIETHTGKDGLVRIVTVRTSSGTTKRAVSKLCKLPVND
ncbi:PREDICTED: uncharacterized protein LOC105556116 [Vollenhovia emeryi]|uniref:uncharacterized protein LOC105556116 n=1 Tax=Vollenhovia emeryi TaxID=411798 RepID=UPI0005F442BF|nr:PREDICTED: uncharacterized protein LOC105556116 [Vollenhovia emeryi]